MCSPGLNRMRIWPYNLELTNTVNKIKILQLISKAGLLQGARMNYEPWHSAATITKTRTFLATTIMGPTHAHIWRTLIILDLAVLLKSKVLCLFVHGQIKRDAYAATGSSAVKCEMRCWNAEVIVTLTWHVSSCAPAGNFNKSKSIRWEHLAGTKLFSGWISCNNCKWRIIRRKVTKVGKEEDREVLHAGQLAGRTRSSWLGFTTSENE